LILASPLIPIPPSPTHTGIIEPSGTITGLQKLYTYPCPGTGGYSEYVKIESDSWNITANWTGYQGDWHSITFDDPFTLKADERYNYMIITGSYPQIIHAKEFQCNRRNLLHARVH
jgi:hypothetical protein